MASRDETLTNVLDGNTAFRFLFEDGEGTSGPPGSGFEREEEDPFGLGPGRWRATDLGEFSSAASSQSDGGSLSNM